MLCLKNALMGGVLDSVGVCIVLGMILDRAPSTLEAGAWSSSAAVEHDAESLSVRKHRRPILCPASGSIIATS